MKRRAFISLLGGATVVWPLATRAQQPGMPLVGILNAGSREVMRPQITAFLEGLKESGYVEGQNLAVEYRFAGRDRHRQPVRGARQPRRRQDRAAMPQAVRLKLIAGPKFDHDVIASTALATGTVAALEIASLVSGFASVAEFTASKVSVVHLEDATPTDVTGGTPSPAVPVKSLFQIDAIGLKTTLWASWGLRAAGHAQWIQGATW